MGGTSARSALLASAACAAGRHRPRGHSDRGSFRPGRVLRHPRFRRRIRLDFATWTVGLGWGVRPSRPYAGPRAAAPCIDQRRQGLSAVHPAASLHRQQRHGAAIHHRYGVGETRAAIELLFTLPGIPLIYDGDEVGAAFLPYDEGPPITWRDPHRFNALYARMSRERRRVHALTAPGL